MIGKVSNSYVRYTRIHHTYHRCIAIHGVHYLRFEDNVCFENMGRAARLVPKDSHVFVALWRGCLLSMPAEGADRHSPLLHPLPAGHAVFVEDAVEVKNVIKGNLVFGTRPCFSCLVTDETPSSYWLVNGDNYVEHNIAGGSTHCQPERL